MDGRQHGRQQCAGPQPDEQLDDQLDDHQRIVSQLGMLFRRVHAMHQGLRRDAGEPALERMAYGLLGHIKRQGPLRLSVLADALHLDLSTVSRQVATLEAAGWLERQPDPADRRASLVQLTEVGHTAVKQHFTRLCDTMAGLLSDWDPAERQELARLLAKFNDTVADRYTDAGRGGLPAER